MNRDHSAVPSELLSIVRSGGTCVLTGAGISTASGIPDYRGSGSKRRTPIQHHEFVGDAAVRRRYWARSAVGWPWMESRKPNAAHRAVAALAGVGAVRRVVTQNVDGLHQKAGTADPVELHGSLSRVVCLDCGRRATRSTFQARLLEANPEWVARTGEIAPDGDAAVSDDSDVEFVVPLCEYCGGVMMPDIVFFGGNVPRSVVAAAFAEVESARSLLVLGSSLTVFSGFRFVRRAAELGKRIAIVNRGATRGDEFAHVTVNAALEEILPALTEMV